MAKADQITHDQGLDTRAMELDLTYKVTNRWSFSTGVRDDMRKDNSSVVPLTQEQGERTDAVAQVKYSLATHGSATSSARIRSQRAAVVQITTASAWADLSLDETLPDRWRSV